MYKSQFQKKKTISPGWHSPNSRKWIRVSHYWQNIIVTWFKTSISRHFCLYLRLGCPFLYRLLLFSTYCGWLKLGWVPIFVVVVEGSIHEFQYPRNDNFLNKYVRQYYGPGFWNQRMCHFCSIHENWYRWKLSHPHYFAIVYPYPFPRWN